MLTVRNPKGWLAGVCVLMLGLFLVNMIGLAVDPRVITGSPAWLKPAKFSISVALYSGTLVWILSKLTVWSPFVELMGKITAVTLLIEIFVIDLQAWRGTSSHFNFQTPLDASLFGIMAFSIAILWLASVGIAAALFRQKFANQTFGWALRLGMLITVLGSASGGMMTHPMPGQKSGIIGSHTVGAPDGGPGITGTGWSANHGDLRIGHFVGLHGMQVVPLFYWLLSRKRRPPVARISVFAASYMGAAILLEWQALRGQSILQPDRLTTEASIAWLALSAIALALTWLPGRKESFQTTAGMA